MRTQPFEQQEQCLIIPHTMKQSSTIRQYIGHRCLILERKRTSHLSQRDRLKVRLQLPCATCHPHSATLPRHISWRPTTHVVGARLGDILFIHTPTDASIHLHAHCSCCSTTAQKPQRIHLGLGMPSCFPISSISLSKVNRSVQKYEYCECSE